MKALFSNPKILAIAIIGLAALLISFAGGALGAAFGGGFLSGPIPLIQLPAEKVVGLGSFDVMNTSVMLWAAGLLLVVISWLATRRMREVPTGLQNLLEVIVEFFDNTADSVAGGARHAGRRFLPLVLVIFLVVLFANWLGTLPGVGTIGRIEPVEEWVEHRIHDKEVEIEEMRNEEGLSHLSEDELHEHALRAVLEENADQTFVVFNGSGGFGTVPVGRGEDAKVALRDVVDIENDDIHHVEEDLHDGVVKRAPADADDPDKHSNLVGKRAGLLVPFFRGASTDLNTTLAIAIVAMISVQIWGIRALGLRHYSGKFIILNKGPIQAFVGFLEAFGEIARTISFTFRLFGNMFAGEILLVVMAFLLPLIGIIPFLGLELFVGLIQAFIFAMLTLVFGVMASISHGDEEHAEEH